ncbi:ABC transporter substrate-binding protein [Fusibacter sp. JL298sf-3]
MKKIWVWLLVLALSIGMLAGCNDTQTEEPNDGDVSTEDPGSELDAQPNTEPTYGGVVSIALSSSPKNLDPIYYTGTYEGNVIRNVADTLVRYKHDLSAIEPNIATEWSVNDAGDAYTFKLREDIFFQKGAYQDGRQLVASDVKFALERSAEHSAMNRLGMLQSVEVVGDFELICHLKQPDAAFLTVLTDAGNVIVPKEEVEGWGDDFGAHLVGSGPFTLVDFKKDQEVILERNDLYWAQKPYLDGVVFKIITDANQMTNALRSGDIDIATDLRGESIPLVEGDKNLVMQEVPGLHVAYMYMNMMEGPTKDKRVREAIIRAVDIDEMVKGIYQYGEADRAYLPLPPNSWGYDASLESIVPTYDPERAKELLKEAGYEDGFSLEIYVSNKPARVKMSTILQAYLKQNLNVDVSIKTVEWGTFSDIASSGQADLYGMSWTWYPDPYFFLNKMFHSSEIGALGNGQGFDDPEVDRLLDEALAVSDTESRAALYKEALKIIAESYARIDYGNEKQIYGLNQSVGGYVIRPDGNIYFCTPEINVYKIQP